MLVVKRRGHKQEYDERKLYASIFAACLNAHILEEEAESIANLVCKQVKEELKNKEEISSGELFKLAGKELGHLNKEAAFMYTTHRDIS